MKKLAIAGLVAVMAAWAPIANQSASADDISTIRGTGQPQPISSTFESDLENLAQTQGLPVDEVIAKYGQQPEFDALNEDLQQIEGSNFVSAEYIGGTTTGRILFVSPISLAAMDRIESSSLSIELIIRGGLSNVQLESSSEAVNAYLKEIDSPFVSTVDFPRGLINLWGNNPTDFEPTLTKLSDLFGRDLFSSVLMAPDVETTQALAANTGGLDIGCSAGYFGAINTSTVGVLTASHCQNATFYLGSQYYTFPNQYSAPYTQGDISWYQIGSMQTGNPLTRSDLSDQVATGSSSKAQITDLMSPSAANPYLGQVVCIHGVVTARACGTIAAVEYTVTWTGSGGTSGSYARMVVINGSLTKAGDSGAAAFSETDTTHVKAVGIVSGVSTSGSPRTFLTRIGAANFIVSGSQNLGIYVILTGY